MNSLFERPFEEEFARQCIMYCYPELGWELELNEIDPPDLVDRIKGIGIEVTSSKPKEDNELDAVYEKYKDREESEIPPKLRKKIDKQQSGKLLFFPDESGKDVLKACYHGARIIDYHEVIARIVKKTERFNKDDYSFFKVDGLFVNDAHSFFWEKSAPDILEEINNRTVDYSRHYHLIFVYCRRDIYLIDIDRRNVANKKLEDEEIQKLVRDSLNALGRSISRSE